MVCRVVRDWKAKHKHPPQPPNQIKPRWGLLARSFLNIIPSELGMEPVCILIVDCAWLPEIVPVSSANFPEQTRHISI